METIMAKQAKRHNIGAAVAKMLGGRADTRKCAEVIAVSLEADGDHIGAALVRDIATKAPLSYHEVNAEKTPVDWSMPRDLSAEFVIDATTGAALEKLVAELREASRFLLSGIDAPTRILFDGPSGTGKTLAARWMGGCLGLPVAILRLDRVVQSFMGATGANIAKAIHAISGVPSILFIDEIDGMSSARGRGDDGASQEASRITSTLLQQLDLLPPEQIVIAATNFPAALDGALLRRLPGRVTFGLPDREARTEMVRRWWARVPSDTDAIQMLVSGTDGSSGASVRAWAMAAARAGLLNGTTIRVEHVIATTGVS